ncbi:hypothetical protein M8C21_002459 [Ambrosia artemisiifolia]|uniref:RING-type domain-containing protein n=1 Tax=Ambrosia artemisiifolia TaxID=4212 RepID=A0AAD5GJA0_AMBAR|nr:hypothetical protein M8C21_002459 [Ambrosia artemisiifolia]
MEDFKVLLYLLILLHVLPPSLEASPHNCPISFCGSSAYSIQFPFRVVGQQQDMCGYPGFNLRCDKQGKLLLNLPNSGDFSVRAIDYRSQTVQVYDPSGCSAARRLTLDLSGSPFWNSSSKNYTLLSCPVEADTSDHITVGCISNSTHSTLAISSESFAMTMANQTSCRIIGSIKTPLAWWQDQGLTSNLNIDLVLTWDNPNCKECAVRGGTCGYTNTTKQDITCYESTKKGNKPQIIAVIIVSIALALPATAASIALACYICRDRRSVATWFARNATPIAPDTATVSNGGIVMGLDQSTIESYTKVILGESKRLPGHGDAACSICLAEYSAKEIVRCIPECRHCFHADCIDEWLKVRGTCPVCRNAPSLARIDLTYS